MNRHYLKCSSCASELDHWFARTDETANTMMRSMLSLAVLLWAATVSALSAAGSRLLVVLDDVEEKAAYSFFLGDLKGMWKLNWTFLMGVGRINGLTWCAERGFEISYETPKSESVSLFHLGERQYDHLIVLPSKVKSMTFRVQFIYEMWRIWPNIE